MSEILIQVDETSLEQSKSGMITGKLCLECSGNHFPEENWNDFVLTVLSWWLSALRGLLKNEEQSTKLRFMDGPFFAKVGKIDNKNIGIEFINSQRGERKVGVATGTIVAFDTSLRDAVMRVLEISRQRGWRSKEVACLEANLCQYLATK
jgi:hypothetical protein